MERKYNIASLGECTNELDALIGGLSDGTKKDLCRHRNIIVRSIENLDTMLGLFDLGDESNLSNANDLSSVISDHINYRYNMKQPGSPMIDYELTNINGWIKDMFKIIDLVHEIENIPAQIRKNKTETISMLAEARAAQKIADEKSKEEYEEMQKKQKVLDDLKKEKIKKIEVDDYGIDKEFANGEINNSLSEFIGKE